MTQTQFLRSYWLLLLVMIIIITIIIVLIPDDLPKHKLSKKAGEYEWDVPDSNRIPATAEGELIRYGKDLVANTSFYLGPRGKISHTSNGMNCQNCHLEAGTRFLGNNYSAVFSTYPSFRARSGTMESIYKRINDCFERSLNGKSVDTASREMQAMYAYMKWLGRQVPRNIKPAGSGIAVIPFLNRAAEPGNGQTAYIQKCQRCHTADGSGLLNADSTAYVYPPLWGAHSYNTGAGLYRLSRFAGYIKYNMPFGATYDSAQLTDEEAWDIAAYVNSQFRPNKKYPKDWPVIAAKPIDHPFGPYADSFSEHQHKYGPFGPVEKNGKTLHQ